MEREGVISKDRNSMAGGKRTFARSPSTGCSRKKNRVLKIILSLI